MGLFSRKTVIDEIKKLFNERNTSIEGDNPFSFQLNLNKYSLFPYITINLNNDYTNLAFIINLRKIDNITNQLYINMNSFNMKSKYLVCKLNMDNILILEYNTIVNTDNVKSILNDVIESVFSLEEEIDLL